MSDNNGQHQFTIAYAVSLLNSLSNDDAQLRIALRGALNELARLQELHSFKPIELAKKDGTKYLIRYEEIPGVVDYLVGYFWIEDEDLNWHDGYGNFCENATHYMELPEVFQCPNTA